MNTWKLLLLQLLIIGLMTSGFCKPSPSADESLDYQNDGDNDEDYDDSESAQNQSNINTNSVNNNNNTAQAYFKLSDYTEKARVGESVTLKCDIENGGPTTMVLWYRGPELKKNLFIKNQRTIVDDRLVIGEKDHSLTINNVTEADQDTYQCQLLPNNIKMMARLVVLSNLQAHIFEAGRDVSGRSITYYQGARIQVECKASGAKNSIDFKWSANGARLQSNENLKINGGILTIEKASRDDIRVYQCLADNGSEGTAHASITINIQYTPRVTAHRSVINTKEGDNAELYCHYDSSIVSRVVWSKNQKPLETFADKRSKYTLLPPKQITSKDFTSILVVNSVNSQDLGVYDCKVENEIGNENVTIELTYAPEPAQFYIVKRNGKSVITHWRIRSKQPIKGIMLSYKIKGEKNWESEKFFVQSKELNDIEMIRNKQNLSPGDLQVRIKSLNTDGWSEYSTLEDIPFEKEIQKMSSDSSSANKIVSSSMMSSVISVAAFISIYSINW